MSIGATTITHWRNQYAQTAGLPTQVFTDFGDDIAHAMLKMIQSGKSSAEAYKIITNGLYAEERAIAANRGRRRKRTSRRAKRTSRKGRRS